MLFQSLMSAAAAAVPQLASALVPKVEEDAEETSKEESPEVPKCEILLTNVSLFRSTLSSTMSFAASAFGATSISKRLP